jgi:hypothetical protein
VEFFFVFHNRLWENIEKLTWPSIKRDNFLNGLKIVFSCFWLRFLGKDCGKSEGTINGIFRVAFWILNSWRKLWENL